MKAPNTFIHTKMENLLDEIVVKVWKLNNIGKYIIIIVLFALLPIPNVISFVQPIILLFSIWAGSYLIRQRWRLSLTDKQIVAKQLFPRPLSYFTKNHHFPLSKIEGLSVGPRAFSSILLLGLFLSTNIGVNLLKSGLSSEGVDLPDAIEAFILILQGMSFFPTAVKLGDQLERNLENTISNIARDVQIAMGTTFIIIGVLIVIFTIPRRFQLQIRVTHGKDFVLKAGITRKFWMNCYKQLYHEDFITPPEKYKVWKYPWLDEEIVENVADLQRTIYLNRFIGIFAIYIGFLRLYDRITGSEKFFSQSVIYWVIVASVDLFIAIVSVRFSSLRNEMVITNKRIIFAEEVKHLSGSFGRRLFYFSDMKRDNVSGFHFKKLKVFSIRYLVLTLLIFSNLVILYDLISPLIRVLFIIMIIISLFFVNQTYIEFHLLTKGGENWKMRHQLSNPATYLRHLVGQENPIVTTFMSNRLEESEIIETVKTIRSKGLLFTKQPSITFSSSSNEKIDNVDNNDLYNPNSVTKFSDNSTQVSAINHTQRNDDHTKLELEDLLLPGEKIQYQTNVSRTVPRRVLTLTIGTLIFLIWIVMAFVPIMVIKNEYTLDADVITTIIGVQFLLIVISIIAIIALWVKYYSFFRAKLVFTANRVFFQDIKNPPLLFYYLGIVNEAYTSEALISEIHSTYVSRQYSQNEYFKNFLINSRNWLLLIILWGIVFAIWNTTIENYVGNTNRASNNGTETLLDQYLSGISLIIMLFLGLISINIAWSAANGFVELMRSLPKRMFTIRGVGFTYTIPFVNTKNADSIRQAIWDGQGIE